MKHFRYFSEHLKKGIEQVLFPYVCLCCGVSATSRKHYICHNCLFHRFDEANPSVELSSSGNILPAGVRFQHSLWRFDEGGALQALLHHLKYGNYGKLGTELGFLLGNHIISSELMSEDLMKGEWLAVPVPLHYRKIRRRGYNQARRIAEGLGKAMGLEVAPYGAIEKMKTTRTQTGFSLGKRFENVKSTFKVQSPDRFCGLNVILVDDVFTTGATTFEIARILRFSGVGNMAIATVAQA